MRFLDAKCLDLRLYTSSHLLKGKFYPGCLLKGYIYITISSKQNEEVENIRIKPARIEFAFQPLGICEFEICFCKWQLFPDLTVEFTVIKTYLV